MNSLNTMNTLNNTFEKKTNIDGSLNPKYIDVLEEDKPIAGQKFSCISFISPEKIIKMRELFFFEQFLKQWELSKSLECYNHFLHFLAYKYSLVFDSIESDFKDFCKDEKDKLCSTTVEDDYKNYIDNNESDLEDKFGKLHTFQTSVRGVKVRGCYPTQEEAELRCKMLREIDPSHDVYVGPVGMWLPFHPEAYKTGRVEYLEEELNQLMHEKRNNESYAKTEFDKRVRDTKEKAMEDNKKKAMESGNVLTQTINEDGQLISVKDMNTTENKLDQNASLSDIRRELFEGDNIVIDKESDHGLGKIAELHANTE